ncbi:MAG: 8-amino-7-oxononanoate synthase [Desulfobacteraceae bacterium]|nr:8-amino-7-oxononanoate synthase [Desulfobacteraceae bacterium]
MFIKRYRQKLILQKQNGLLRNPPVFQRRQGKYLWCNGQKMLNWASNDYLGLGASEQLRNHVAANFNRYGSSSSSSRLVSGNFALIEEAERVYAAFFGYEQALFFPSGYQANLGVLATFFEPGDTVFFDKHIHASSVKALLLSRSRALGYNHGDLSHLKKRLEKSQAQAAVVTESLFSMDGDSPDFKQLSALKQTYGFMCIVDEAHGFGVLGPQGQGLAAGAADVAVGTFGKAFGLFGAFVLLPAELKDYLLNFSSPQIYTTTLPEAHAASTLNALELVCKCDGQRQHLTDLARYFKKSLQQAGFSVSGHAHILAIKIGPEAKTMALASRLKASGHFVLPARYPTVALGKAIVRISLTAAHTNEDILSFITELKEAYEVECGRHQ